MYVAVLLCIVDANICIFIFAVQSIAQNYIRASMHLAYHGHGSCCYLLTVIGYYKHWPVG